MVTVKFGLKSVQEASLVGNTVANLKSNQGIQSYLGFTGNENVLVNQVRQGDDYILRAGDTVSLQTAVASKA